MNTPAKKRSLTLAAFLLSSAALPVQTSIATPAQIDTCTTTLTEVQTPCDCDATACSVVKTLTPMSLDNCSGCKLEYTVWVVCGEPTCTYKDSGELGIICNSNERLQEACPGDPNTNIFACLFSCGDCQ